MLLLFYMSLKKYILFANIRKVITKGKIVFFTIKFFVEEYDDQIRGLNRTTQNNKRVILDIYRLGAKQNRKFIGKR